MAMAAQAIGELQAIQLIVKTAAKQLLPFPVYLKKTYSLSGFIFKILSTVMLCLPSRKAYPYLKDFLSPRKRINYMTKIETI